MSQLTLTDIKRHCQALDFDDDDVHLQSLWETAEAFVQDYLRRDLDTELPGAWPKACTGAVKMLVAQWYDVAPHSVAFTTPSEMPFTVRELLAAHRDLS